MTAAPTLWTKHRGLAHMLASRYHIPGSDRDDVHQEALIGLWIACRNWDRDKSSFPVFARMVISGRLNTLVKNALRGKHRLLTDSSRDEIELSGGVDVERVVVARESLERIVLAIDSLSVEQRKALGRIVNEVPIAGKTDGTHRYRARKKLKAAA